MRYQKSSSTTGNQHRLRRPFTAAAVKCGILLGGDHMHKAPAFNGLRLRRISGRVHYPLRGEALRTISGSGVIAIDRLGQVDTGEQQNTQHQNTRKLFVHIDLRYRTGSIGAWHLGIKQILAPPDFLDGLDRKKAHLVSSMHMD
jgi:hypothetical protein